MPAFHSLVLPWDQNGTPGVPRLPGGRIQGLCKEGPKPPGGRIQGLCKEGPKPPGGRIQKPALHRPGSPHSKKPSLISCAFPQFHPGSQLLRYCLPTKMGNPKSPHPEPDPAQVHPTARSVASNGVLPVQLHASVRLLSTALGPKRNAGCPTSARFWQIWEATTQNRPAGPEPRQVPHICPVFADVGSHNPNPARLARSPACACRMALDSEIRGCAKRPPHPPPASPFEPRLHERTTARDRRRFVSGSDFKRLPAAHLKRAMRTAGESNGGH
jgi:hypothetical protein